MLSSYHAAWGMTPFCFSQCWKFCISVLRFVVLEEEIWAKDEDLKCCVLVLQPRALKKVLYAPLMLNFAGRQKPTMKSWPGETLHCVHLASNCEVELLFLFRVIWFADTAIDTNSGRNRYQSLSTTAMSTQRSNQSPPFRTSLKKCAAVLGEVLLLWAMRR